MPQTSLICFEILWDLRNVMKCTLDLTVRCNHETMMMVVVVVMVMITTRMMMIII